MYIKIDDNWEIRKARISYSFGAEILCSVFEMKFWCQSCTKFNMGFEDGLNVEELQATSVHFLKESYPTHGSKCMWCIHQIRRTEDRK